MKIAIVTKVGWTKGQILRHREIVLLVALVILYTTFWTTITILRHHSFQSTGLDLGLFEQSLWTTVNQGKLLFNNLFGASELGDNAYVFLLLIVPIYAIFQHTETLLFLQSLALGLGAIPVYWMAKQELGLKYCWLFASLYLLYPALHQMNWFDFHPEAFAVPLLLFAFYFYSRGHIRRFLLCVALTLTVKTDAALVVGALGAYLMAQNLWGKSKPKVGFRTAIFITAAAALWLALWIGFLLPLLKGGSYIYIADRFLAQGLTFGLERVEALLWLFGPLAFLPLISPILVIALPSIIENMASNWPPQYMMLGQYSAYIVPVIFVAAIKGVKVLGNRGMNLHRAFPAICLLLVFSTAITIGFVESRYYGISERWHPPSEQHVLALERAVELVPPDASILTQNNIFPHVSRRGNAYSNSVSGNHAAREPGDSVEEITEKVTRKTISEVEYVLVDTSPTLSWLLGLTDIEGFGVQFAADGVFLLKRGYQGQPETLVSGQGLLMEYYDNGNLEGTPVLIHEAGAISFDWHDNAPIPIKGIIPPDEFSIRWSGYLHTPVHGEYGFHILSDDGSRLILDGKTVLDGWGNDIFQGEASVYLTEGFHSIVVEYKEHAGMAGIWFEWRPPWEAAYQVVASPYLTNLGRETE